MCFTIFQMYNVWDIVSLEDKKMKKKKKKGQNENGKISTESKIFPRYLGKT